MLKLPKVAKRAAVERWLKSIPDISSPNDIDSALFDLEIEDNGFAFDDVMTCNGNMMEHKKNAIRFKKINLYLDDNVKNNFPTRRSSIQLHGSKCNLTDGSSAGDSKIKNVAADDISKRSVTFKTMPAQVLFDDDEDMFMKKTYRLTQPRVTKMKLACNTTRSSKAAKAKELRNKRETRTGAYVVCEKSRSNLVDKGDSGGQEDNKTAINHPHLSKLLKLKDEVLGDKAQVPVITNTDWTHTLDDGHANAQLDDVMFDTRSKTTISSEKSKKHVLSKRFFQRASKYSGSTRSVVSLLDGPKTLHLSAAHKDADDVFMRKPLIKGLVVDSASNQKASIVRASKNANIREEFALKQRVDGYRSACSQNINTINMAQRRMSSSLAHLKSKMATTTVSARSEEIKNIKKGNLSGQADADTDELCLQNKGHVPLTEGKQTTIPYCFPPLTYPNRRMLSMT